MAECAAALHGFAEVTVRSMTCTFTAARHREDGILVKLEVSLEEFLGFCLGGLMRFDDLSIFGVNFVET